MIAREIAVVGCIFSATIFGSIGLMEAARQASDSDAVGRTPHLHRATH